MVLSDRAILKAIKEGSIVIQPFDLSCLGTNSYDVHLSKNLAMYEKSTLDAAKFNKLKHFEIGPKGYVLRPGKLYLGSTIEYTESHKTLPYIDGKSSTGRLGICIHLTAGRGDVGFCNFFTLELTVVQPVRVYAGMPIAQLTYHTIEGEVAVPYNKKANAKFTHKDHRPMESAMYKNKFRPNREDFLGFDADHPLRQDAKGSKN